MLGELTWGQLFSALLGILVADLVLGGDNALIIAMASRRLPQRQRWQAMIWGTVGAVGLRMVLTSVVVYLIRIPLLQAIAGLLLAWISVKLLLDDHEVHVAEAASFAGAIKTIIFADFIMSLDNVLAVAGASHGHVGLVILGLAISVPIIIWGSNLVSHLMNRYPIVIWIGAGILAWTSGRMMAHDPWADRVLHLVPFVEHIWPWIVTVLALAIAYLVRARRVSAPGHGSGTATDGVASVREAGAQQEPPRLGDSAGRASSPNGQAPSRAGIEERRPL